VAFWCFFAEVSIHIVLFWDTFDEAYKESKKFEKKTKSTFVHPFDDKKIITWQATIWLEIYESMNPDFIICPIGGGWLVSWIISITKELDKKTKIVWVEPEWAAAMKHSLQEWENTALDEIDTFIDGASVKKVWDITFKIAKEYKLPVLTCPENRVCSTMLEYLKEDWMVVEPAWALSTDALKDMKKEIKWKEVVIIISWSNFDFERIQEVKERKMKFEWLKRYFVVTFPQRPWALKDFLTCLWKHDDIARFEYLKKSNKNRAPAFIWIETDQPKNWKKITKNMDKLWFKYHDVTNDELYFDLLV
jgi:threonine dehydratase